MASTLSHCSRSSLIRAALLLGATTSALSAQEPVQAKREAPAIPPEIVALVEAHNRERAKENLPPLKFEARLGQVALAHARDMAARGVMSHEGSDGSTPIQRIDRSGYHHLTAGENVARGYRDVPEVMRGWMDSPPHRKNILGDYTEIGVAKAEGKGGKPYWAAEFGKPMPKLDPAEAATTLVKRINQERSAAKLPELTVDARLARPAEAVARDLARNKGKASSPSPFEKIDQKPFRELAMTTSSGNPDAEALVKGLMESPDYKAQILGKSTKVGVGYAIAEDGTPHWSLILGIPARR